MSHSDESNHAEIVTDAPRNLSLKPQVEDMAYRCEICFQIFNDWCSFEHHRQTHENDMQWGGFPPLGPTHGLIGGTQVGPSHYSDNVQEFTPLAPIKMLDSIHHDSAQHHPDNNHYAHARPNDGSHIGRPNQSLQHRQYTTSDRLICPDHSEANSPNVAKDASQLHITDNSEVPVSTKESNPDLSPSANKDNSTHQTEGPAESDSNDNREMPGYRGHDFDKGEQSRGQETHFLDKPTGQDIEMHNDINCTEAKSSDFSRVVPGAHHLNHALPIC